MKRSVADVLVVGGGPAGLAAAIELRKLGARNVRHEYHVYQGEGHGWRKAETIEACYTSLERFLRANIGPR